MKIVRKRFFFKSNWNLHTLLLLCKQGEESSGFIRTLSILSLSFTGSFGLLGQKNCEKNHFFVFEISLKKFFNQRRFYWYQGILLDIKKKRPQLTKNDQRSEKNRTFPKSVKSFPQIIFLLSLSPGKMNKIKKKKFSRKNQKKLTRWKSYQSHSLKLPKGLLKSFLTLVFSFSLLKIIFRFLNFLKGFNKKPLWPSRKKINEKDSDIGFSIK